MLLATPGMTAPAATANEACYQRLLNQVLAAGIAENPYLQNQACHIHFLPVVLGPSSSARVGGQL